MWGGKRRVGIVTLIGTMAGSAWAQDGGSRALGRGGVGRADAADTAGEEQSLAANALDPRYEIYAGAELGPNGRFLARGGAVDSRTSKVTLGAGYMRLADDVLPPLADLPGWRISGEPLSNPSTWQRFHIGVAVPLLERRLSLATQARYDWRTSALLGEEKAFNFGFSVAGRPIPQLTIAGGAANLLENDFHRVGREGSLAVRWDPGPYLGLEGDVVAPLDPSFGVDRFDWRVGIDGGFVSWLVIRGGWSMESEVHYASAGLGLVSEHATLEYGARVRPTDWAHWHALDVRVVF